MEDREPTLERKNDQILRGFKEVAGYLNIGRDSARKLMNTPGFPVIIVSPRIRLVTVKALTNWLFPNNNS